MFEKLGLMPKLSQSVIAKGYSEATPIQEKAIPVILQGRDVLGGAQTGTGKTAAFALPVLQLLGKSAKQRAPRVLVMTPTRELATQVHESFIAYGRPLDLRSTVVFGGVGINPQINRLKKGLDILVACPGRLLDHAGRKAVDLSKVEILILDEADHMLDMGFIHDIRRIIKLLPAKRQNLLFSATYSREIKELASTVLQNPEMIEVARQNCTAENVQQVVHPVSLNRKRSLLSHLIKKGQWNQVLVFTKTKRGANNLTKHLLGHDIHAVAIHGNKSQSARTRALDSFKKKDVRVLVATDIAARGLDIDQLPHVVNYDLPNVPEDYVHRIGRTGRAGLSGEAVSLVTQADIELLEAIQGVLGSKVPVEMIAGFEVDYEFDVAIGKTKGKAKKKSNAKKGQKAHSKDRPKRRRKPRRASGQSDSKTSDAKKTGPKKIRDSDSNSDSDRKSTSGARKRRRKPRRRAQSQA